MKKRRSEKEPTSDLWWMSLATRDASRQNWKAARSAAGKSWWPAGGPRYGPCGSAADCVVGAAGIPGASCDEALSSGADDAGRALPDEPGARRSVGRERSEEHTSELQ